MKKKLFTAVLSVMLLGVFGLPVYADDLQVDYKQESTWTVSIPKTTLSQTQEKEQTVTAEAVNIRPEAKLQVTVKGLAGGKVTLTRTDGNATTTSTVSYVDNNDVKHTIDSDTVIAEFVDQSTAFANSTTGKLLFSPIDEGTKAGDYTGTITYVMETVNRN